MICPPNMTFPASITTTHQPGRCRRRRHWRVVGMQMRIAIFFITVTSSALSRKFHTHLTGFGSSHHHHHHPHSDASASGIAAKKSIFTRKQPDALRSNTNNHTGFLWVHKASSHSLYFKSNVTSNDTVVCITAIDEHDDSKSSSTTTTTTTKDWKASIVTSPKRTSQQRNKTAEPTHVSWIPVEGIYGVYKVPSGTIWVLITSSDSVYENDYCHIRRIRGLELVHLRPRGPRGRDVDAHTAKQRQTRAVSRRQVKEEARQLRLLRQALRHHTFYFTVLPQQQQRRNGGSNGATSFRDMTHSLQRSILWQQEQHRQQQPSMHADNETSRAEVAVRRPLPDSRFFWNEACVQDILHPDMQHKRQQQHKNACQTILAPHVIPITSAFVGVQRNISLPAGIVAEKKSSTGGGGSSCQQYYYDQVLISRRSRFRAGTRFTKRGADSTGAVANYAETEQLCWLYKKTGTKGVVANAPTPPSSLSGVLQQVFSHVQTRGSIPLRWSSPADVKTYRPRVRIGTDPLAQARAVHSHLVTEFAHYAAGAAATRDSMTTSNIDSSSARIGSQHQHCHHRHPQLIFVNLVDKKQDQGRLGRSFDAVLQAVLDICGNATSTNNDCDDDEEEDYGRQQTPCHDTVQHLWFDFHAQVKGGRWERLGSLLKEVKPTLNEQGYFSAVPDASNGTWAVLRTQSGVIRTNCMDCLDRTNVVQSIFGRYMLFQQLESVVGNYKKERVLPSNFTKAFRRNSLALPWTAGEVSHRLLWADNADAISKLYAGTPALKGDFTRTGKRTKKGALDDGMNSLQRYYLNNFLDADRQEGMDLLVGYADFSTDPMPIGEEKFAKERRIAASRGLELLWLPGDLQSHVKSHAWGVSQRTKDALESMDQRAASDQPWWIAEETSSSEGDSGDDKSVVRSTVNTGYLIGGLVAALKAPAATAAAIICMLGFSNTDSRSKGKGDTK